MSEGVYRGRFAPSPTGRVHLGTARTALIAWLRARSEGGAFVMRMEDIDGPRVVPGAAESILSDLRWLGIDWDEGPDVGGPHAPYVQSERLDLYRAAIDRLRASSRVYPCTCSRKEIASIASAPHDDEGPIYPGTCRNGPAHPDREASLRFRFDEGGDFIVQRRDGVFAYHLAVVVDDLAMGITEVVRGADLTTSMPRQIALARALGGEPPSYVHVPLVLGSDGTRLAKRHGAIAIADLRDRGLAAERIVGSLARSARLIDRDEPARASDLIESFDLARVLEAARETTLQ